MGADLASGTVNRWRRLLFLFPDLFIPGVVDATLNIYLHAQYQISSLCTGEGGTYDLWLYWGDP